MTLKEQFTFNFRECDYEENAETSVNIADEFAIGFAEWSICKVMGFTKFELNKDELEIYKKEKGL